MTEMVNPEAIPGTKMDLGLVEAAATSMTSMGSTVRTEGGNAVSHWSMMSGVYEAPESAELLAVMDPVGVDTTTVGDDLEAIGGALATFAGEAEPIHQRLKQLKTDAEAFVTKAQAGITLEYGDIHYHRVNPAIHEPGFMPVIEPPAMHCEWDNYPPYVEENKQLIVDIATQVELMEAAAIECANAIVAANSYVCRAQYGTGQDLSTLAENGAEMPWGTAGKGDRTCAEGAWDAGVESVEGVGMLFGYNPMLDIGGDGEIAAEAWKGLGMSMLGLITMTSPASYGIQALPDNILPELQNFLADTNEAGFSVITGFTGTGEDWSSDPDAAAGALMFNVGTSLIPGAGLGAGAVKIVSTGTRGALRGLDADAPRPRIDGPDSNHRVDLPNADGINLSELNTQIGDIDIDIDLPNTRPDGADVPAGRPDGPDARPDSPDAHAPDSHPSESGGHPNGEQTHADNAVPDGATAPDGPDVTAPETGRPDADAPAQEPTGGGISEVNQGKIDGLESKIEQIQDGVWGPEKDYLVPIFEGRIFELENAHRYDLNDFHVTKPDSALNADGYANPNGQGSYNRPDSYNLPRDGAPGEIIERKHTQLDEIQPSTWKSYLTQLEQKYAPQRNDIVIADTPSNRAKIEQQGLDPDIIGRPLTGDQIIEVPVQAKAPSVEMLEMADTRRIEVREADGSVWDIAPNGTDVMRIRPDGSVDHYAPGDVV